MVKPFVIDDSPEERGRFSIGRPKKAIEVVVTIGGFAWDSVEKRLRDLADDLRAKREHAGSATACGYGTSSSLDVYVRDVTPDAYVEEALGYGDFLRKLKREADQLRSAKNEETGE